jgi:hypothetical protein
VMITAKPYKMPMHAAGLLQCQANSALFTHLNRLSDQELLPSVCRSLPESR